MLYMLVTTYISPSLELPSEPKDMGDLYCVVVELALSIESG